MESLKRALFEEQNNCHSKSTNVPIQGGELNIISKSKSGGEIGQENLKTSLQEIIKEIEQVASHDELLCENDGDCFEKTFVSDIINEIPNNSKTTNLIESGTDNSEIDNMIENKKYNFLSKDNLWKTNANDNGVNKNKSLSEQLNDFWITPADVKPNESSIIEPESKEQPPDLLNLHTILYYNNGKSEKINQRNETLSNDKENDSTSEEHTVEEGDVLGEINSLIVHLEQITKRPKSLPPDVNVFQLWKSLQIANELNQKLKEEITVENAPFPSKDIKEKSGHLPNGLPPAPHKPIDLDKLFTPAPDTGELITKNRKHYTSSSFYSPNHPTLEDQVDLARRISKSLTDISNHESKGQSMYVNRKKRSVKWVHEGEGKNSNLTNSFTNHDESSSQSKQLLKLVTDPRGQVQDIQSLRKQGYNSEPCLSPEICFDLVRDLNGPKGKGAELFAKRRKKSEKWIIDEHNVKTTSYSSSTGVGPNNLSAPSTPLINSTNKLPPPPLSYLPGNAKRFEQVQKMNEVQERLSQPRVRLIKSPWEAALETGSVDSAFVEVEPRGFVVAPTPSVFENIQRGGEKVPPTPPVRQYQSLNIDFSTLPTYNTAPRGWGSNMAFYKPVYLDSKPQKVSMTPTYTDF